MAHFNKFLSWRGIFRPSYTWITYRPDFCPLSLSSSSRVLNFHETACSRGSVHGTPLCHMILFDLVETRSDHAILGASIRHRLRCNFEKRAIRTASLRRAFLLHLYTIFVCPLLSALQKCIRIDGAVEIICNQNTQHIHVFHRAN